MDNFKTSATPPGWYRIAWSVAKDYFRTFHDQKAFGTEHIPEGGCILASNHVSFFDPPLIGTCVERPFYYLARKTLFVPPVMDKLLPRIQAIPVDQEKPDMVGLKRIIHLLRSGEGIVLFPEGERSTDGKILSGQPGVGLVVAKSRVPVIPTRIFGGHAAWPRGGKPRPFTPLKIVFGPPMTFTPPVKPDKNAYLKISETIIERIGEMELPSDAL